MSSSSAGAPGAISSGRGAAGGGPPRPPPELSPRESQPELGDAEAGDEERASEESDDAFDGMSSGIRTPAYSWTASDAGTKSSETGSPESDSIDSEASDDSSYYGPQGEEDTPPESPAHDQDEVGTGSKNEGPAHALGDDVDHPAARSGDLKASGEGSDSESPAALSAVASELRQGAAVTDPGSRGNKLDRSENPEGDAGPGGAGRTAIGTALPALEAGKRRKS